VALATLIDGSVNDAAEAGAPSDAAREADAPPTGLTFGGVMAVAPASDTSLLVVWNAAVDNTNPLATVRYRVFVGPPGKPLAYDMPAAITEEGALSTVVDQLDVKTAYVVGVRAVDSVGLEDTNTVTLTQTTGPDPEPPVFAGLTSAAPGGSGAVLLKWAAGTDDVTSPPAISYLVYESDTPGMEDYTTPVLATPPGATSAVVDRLPNDRLKRYFVVRARDAAGATDLNTVEIGTTPGPDTVPPNFGGCSAATKTTAITIAVSWSPATDDVSAPANISYAIYSSETPGVYDFSMPLAQVKGQDVVVFGSLKPSTRYSFVCRAKDEAGNQDSNTIEVSAVTGANPTPPTFAGITTLVGDPVARTATISWAAGTDPVTPQNELVYDVYVAQAPGAEVFSAMPLATSAAGATSIMVSNLAPNATLYFVVRARDLDGNEDTNTVEKSMVTNVSFSLNVQPIFTHDCGVVGCHVPGNPTGGLILAEGFAYAQIVGVNALEALGAFQLDGGAVDYINPGDPSDSYLNIKINAPLLSALKASLPASVGGRLGTQMPAPSTGSTLSQADLATISNWIVQGAPNN
jgi:hypothetical protein